MTRCFYGNEGLTIKLKTQIRETAFLFVAGIVAFGSNSYQQALDYASALNKPSLDLPTLIAGKSNSALYWSIDKFLEFGLSPFLISLLINFILHYFFLNRLFKVNTLIGFRDIHAVALTFFMVFTYTFLSPFAYEIQVLGTITQGRMTPLLILLLMSFVLSPSQPTRDFKIILVICLTLSIHPIIGIFLLNFTILIAVFQKSKILNLLTLCSINVISILILLRSNFSQATNDSGLLSEFHNSIYGKNFCHHYSNIINFANDDVIENNLRNLVVYLIIMFLILFKYRRINSENTTFRILSIFLIYAFFLSMFLNLIIIMNTPLSSIAFSIMPLRFLDAANMFVFPILLMILLKTVGATFFVYVLCGLSALRIVNARSLDFLFKENELHFISLILLLVILPLIMKNSMIQNLGKRFSQQLGFIPLILFIPLAAFIWVQISHVATSPGTDWNSIKTLTNLTGFNGSKILTSQGIYFPMAINDNYQVLNYGELQSIIYVPEALPYVEQMLKRYYRTSLSEYFGQSSCALETSDRTRSEWESWDGSKWRKLSIEDGFKYVIVPKSWNLKLTQTAVVTLGTKIKQEVSVYIAR